MQNFHKKRDVIKSNHRFNWKMALIPVLAVAIVCTILFTILFRTQGVSAEDNLMNSIQKKNVDTPIKVSDEFVNASADFSIKLFQKSIQDGKNSLISPPSVYFALGMTANGADGETLSEFEKVLGGGKLKIDELNTQYLNMKKNLESVQNGKLKIANSIWFRDDKSLNIKKDFLQTNADYFGAAAYKQDFSKPQTADAINNWVKQNTDGKIDKMVEKIDDSTMLYLINTVLFESEWQVPYEKENISELPFHSAKGIENASFMKSKEKYIHDEEAQGIIKDFNNQYQFVAILPNERMDLKSYIESMTGEKLLSLIKNIDNGPVISYLPKFKYDYEISMNQPLIQLGLNDALNSSKANFKNMGNYEDMNLYIQEVLQKTFIEVDELGTKAGAATKVEMAVSGCAGTNEQGLIIIKFDRPFVYAIVDSKTELPVFIGTVEKP